MIAHKPRCQWRRPVKDEPLYSRMPPLQTRHEGHRLECQGGVCSQIQSEEATEPAASRKGIKQARAFMHGGVTNLAPLISLSRRPTGRHHFGFSLHPPSCFRNQAIERPEK